jgi:hypothetical protein
MLERRMLLAVRPAGEQDRFPMTVIAPRSFPWLSAVVAAVLATAARADEFRLHDGRVIVGRPVEKGSTFEVVTRDGVVIVPKAEVKQRASDADLRDRLAAQAKGTDDSMYAHLHLAGDAFRYGLDAEVFEHLDLALAARDAGERNEAAGLARRLADFLGQLEPAVLPARHRGQKTDVRVQQLLQALRTDGGAGRAAAIEELLVREPGADQELRRQARTNSSPARRMLALAALERRPLAGNDRFLLRTTILDGNESVRSTAAAMLRPSIDSEAIAYLGAGLLHPNSKMRIRTAEALADLGHADAVKLLVMAGPQAHTAAAGGGSDALRSHIAIVQQQAYIRDFDVEVASSSFIADPKIGLLQSGVVLDVGTIDIVTVRTTVVRAYRTSLQKLTNSDPGDNPAHWASWLAQRAGANPPPTTGAPTRATNGR